MIGIHDWIRDLLMSRGALVEAEEDGRIRAMLPAEVAASLGATDWLSLDLRPHPGGDDAVEWMDRMERLLPSQPLLVSAQVRTAPPAPIDAAAVISSELPIQNGVCRVVEDFAAVATYLFFTFQYTVESDDRSVGTATVCVNADAGSIVTAPERFLLGIRDDLRDDEQIATPDVLSKDVLAKDVLAKWYPAAVQAVRSTARRHAVPAEQNANRRLARDTERVASYYDGLLAQARKRIARKAGDEAAAEKERSRTLAVEADRNAKLEDLRRKYALHIRTDLSALLAVRAPVRHVVLRLIRKKEERAHTLHWNPVLKALDQPLCEHCSARAHPLYLCERVHLLCKDCWAQCAECSRFFCRVCQRQCKCGAGKAVTVP